MNDRCFVAFCCFLSLGFGLAMGILLVVQVGIVPEVHADPSTTISRRGEWRTHWTPEFGFFDCFHGEGQP